MSTTPAYRLLPWLTLRSATKFLLSLFHRINARLVLLFILLSITSLQLQAQESITLSWPLTSPDRVMIPSGRAYTGFGTGTAVGRVIFDRNYGAMAGGWNSPDLNPAAFYEYRIAPVEGSSLSLSQLKVDISLGSGEMHMVANYSTDGFSSPGQQIGQPLFFYTTTPQTLTLTTGITVSYPDTLRIRIYAWGATGRLAEFNNRNLSIEGEAYKTQMLTAAEKNQVQVKETAESPEEILQANGASTGNLHELPPENQDEMLAPLGTDTTFIVSGTWTCPVGVTCVKVECWGGGGKGGSRISGPSIGLGGAGGGAYSRSVLSVIPGNSYTVVVGAGGTNNTNPGEDTYFNNISTVLAKGGNSVPVNSSAGVAGGSAAASVGDIKYSGGSGANGSFVTNPQYGGGGGSSAGSAANGNNGITFNGGAAPVNGGPGGNGYVGNNISGNGVAASPPPGGAGGGGLYNSTNPGSALGGNGARGQLIISWANLSNTNTPVVSSPICAWATSVSGTCSEANGTVIEVFVDGSSGGTTSVISNAWTKTGLTPLIGGQVVTATAKVIDKCLSAISAGVTVTASNTITLTSGNNIQTVCINTPIANITYTSTGATGATFSGLPAGVSGTYSGGNITISGTPTVSGTFNYTVTLTGGCGVVTATGTITVTLTSITLTSGNNIQTVCINTSISNITYTSTGSTGATFSGLPAGVSGTYSGGNITISGTPTVSGTFNYTVTLTGNCGVVIATGTITVNLNNTITLTSGNNIQTRCINTAIANITYTSTGATGATFSGLPTGVSGTYSGGNITISGTPTVSGTFNYTVTLTGGCGVVTATGTITVTPNNTITLTSANNIQTVCINTAIANITYTTTGATGATFSGLPAGVSGTYSGGNITISGTPTVSGTFNYTVTLTGGCGVVFATGTITVYPLPTVTCPANFAICFNASPVTLTGGSPVGGNYSGPGVSGGVFNPSVAGVGIHTITYSYTNSNGCTNTCTFQITVNPVPNALATPSSQTICSGSAITTIVLTGNVTGTTFNWVRNNIILVTGIPANGIGNISGSLTNMTNAPITVTFTITPTANGCTGAPITATVLVNPTPNVTANPGIQSVCHNSATIPIIFNSNVTGTIFNWTNNQPSIGLAPSGTGNIASFIAVNTGSTPVIATITVTPSFTNGGITCTGPSQTVTITVKPLPILTSNLNPPGICSGTIFSYTPTSSTPLTVFNWSRAAVPGISEPANSGLGNPNEILTNTTADPITVIYVYTLTASGCTNPSPYNVSVVVSPQPVLISDPTPPDICSGTLFSYVPLSNVGGTTFQWSRASITGILPAGTSGTGNPNEVLTNITALPISVRYIYTLTAAGCLNPTTFNVDVIVNPTPLLSSSLTPPAICSGTLFSYTPTSNTPGTTFSWSRAVVAGISNPAATGSDNPNEILVNTTNVTVNVTYVYTLAANGCTHVQNVVVGVKPTPTVNPIADKFYCNGFAVPVTPVTGPVAGTSFAWTNSNTAIGLGASGTGNIPAFTATNPGDDPITATISITPTANGCTGPIFSYIITVYPSPLMTSDLTPPDICSGTEFDYEPESNVDGAIFTWNRAAVAGISNPAASGSGNPHEILINTTVNPVNVTYVYTLSANGCNSPLPYNVVVKVNPTPTLTSTLNPQAICSNTLFSYNPTSGTAGTVFNWTRPAVAGISNPAASGMGNPNEILINTTTGQIPVIYIYTLTANGCSNVQNVTVLVKPAPTVDFIADQEYCNGDAVPVTILTGPITGTTFTWTNNNTAIGLGASGTGNVPAFTATNITAAPLVATITIIPTAALCTGTPLTYTITVYPAATVNPIANQVYCNGDAAPLTVVTGPISGTTFTWTNSDPSIGLPAGGTGDVPAFTATNISTVPVVATITITPFYGTCDGIPSGYTITVNPAPTVNPVSDQNYCEGETAPATILTGTVAGTVFNWVNDNTGIGLGASGSGNIPSFITTNSTPNPIMATITITPAANGCSGASTSYTITVNPTPELSSSLNPPGICSESQFYYEPTSTTSSVIFAWTRAAIAGIINPPASGTGVIDEELENTTFSPIAVTYVYTLTANGCTNVQNVVVVVSPIPTLSLLPPPPETVCSNSLFTYTPSGPVAGTVFAWSRAAVAGISNPPASGVGSINETLINTTTGSIPVTYVFTMSIPGCTNPDPVNIPVVVVPAPVVSAWASTIQVCSGQEFDLFSSSNLGPTLPPILLSENFNSGTAGSTNGPNGWTTTNSSSGGTPALARWTLRNSPYNNGWVNVNSGDALFYHANSRAQGGGLGTTTNTSLISPSISINSGYISLSLTFRTYYDDNNSNDFGYVEVYNGVSWATIATLNQDYGTPSGFVLYTVSLNSYIFTPTIQIRFRYSATRDRYWAIDNVTVTGTSPIPIATWTSIPAGFNYIGNNPPDVTQTETTSYIATYNSADCPGRDTVTVAMAPVPDVSITADYCSVEGEIELTAHPDGLDYSWSTGESTQTIHLDEVGIYSVTVTNSYGCAASAFLDVSNELVIDGSFTNFVAASPVFFTEYTQNQAYYTGVPTSGLWPEGYYAVNISAWSNWPNPPQGHHPLFHGRDHTNNTVGPRNFLMVNGSTTLIEDPPGSGNWRQRIIWQETVSVLPNTNYYFSAWGMNLNPTAPAKLQFEVNGVLVGSVADLNVAPKPTTEAEVALSNWVRFYSTPFWYSGSATTAVIRIRNLNTIPGGNDFGLDDISFGTLDPIPADPNPEANAGDPLCEGDTLFLTSNITGGLEPIVYSWTGPDGFISNLPNPIIYNVDEANAGVYYLTVTDAYGCDPVTATTTLTIIPAATATLSPSENVCVNDPEPLVTFTGAEGLEPYTFFYTLNAGPEQSITTISGNTVSISVPTSIPGIFVYVLTGVIDQNGCPTTLNDTCIITVSEVPECLITGDEVVCPNATGIIYNGPVGMASYAWSIIGNGLITGPTNEAAVTVTAGPGCNNTFTLSLLVTNTDDCSDGCTFEVSVTDNEAPAWVSVPGDLDVILSCEDAAGIANALNLEPEAADNCTDYTITLVYDENIPGSCTGEYVIERRWEVDDECSNAQAALFVQIITVQDNSAPAWTTLPGALDVTLDCGDVAGLAAAQELMPAASDNCDIDLVVVKTAGAFVPGLCAQSGSYTNTFTVSDDCGNSASAFTQVITINDNSAPDITCPGNISIDCDGSIDPVNTGTAITTDNCDPDPLITYTDVTIAGGCADAYTIQRTWIATDDCGYSSSCVQVISVQDVTPPLLIGVPANVTVPCDAIPAPPTVTASDNCDNNVMVSFSETNNTVNGCGNIIRNWSATDDCGNTASASQVITVIDNTPPELAGVPPDITVACDEIPDPALVTATDNCDPTVTVIFEETINTISGGCGEIIRTWSSTDYCGNTSTGSQTITVEDTEAPEWITPPDDLNVALQCNDEIGKIIAQALEPIPYDYCDPDLDPVKVSGQFVTGACPQEGTYTNTWTVTDFCSNTSVIYTQMITIEDNAAPAWDLAPNLLNRNLTCTDIDGLAAALALAPTATDNCGAASVNLVSDITILSGCNGSYIRTRKWSATDECSNTNAIQYTQIISVTDNVAPVWDQAAGDLDASVACDDPDGLNAALSLAPTATDECGSGININLESDEVFTGGCPGTYTRVRTWSVSDDCGNINPGDYTQTISVIDDEEPVYYNIPAGVTLSCEDPLPPVPTDIIAFDLCSDDVTSGIVFSESPLDPDPSCPNGGVITRTWTVDDGCGNIAIATQLITITDNVSPLISCPDSIFTTADAGETFATVSLSPPVYSDNCSAFGNIDLSWVMTGATVDNGIGIIPDPFVFNAGVTTVTYIATDECGNINNCQFTVTVESNDPPEISCPGNISQDTDPGLCTAAISPGFPVLISGTLPITYTWEMTGASTGSGTGPILPDPYPFNAGLTTITWIATNVDGADTCSQTITVTDNEPPAFDTPGLLEFCVEYIVTAEWDGQPEPFADIVPERPDWYIVNGTTELDISNIDDNCCDDDEMIISWTITFNEAPAHPPVIGTGQPSDYGPITLWGTTDYTVVVRQITYVVEDCNGNLSDPVTVDITIKPRPNVIKVY